MKTTRVCGKAVLVFNSGREDRKAYDLILESGLPCEFIGSISEARTPILVWHNERFMGVDEIDRVVRRWQGRE